MIFLIATWIFLFCLIFGLGSGFFAFLFRFGGPEFKIVPSIFQVFWLGFSIIILFVQIYSLFMKIDLYAVLLLLFLSIIGVPSAIHIFMKMFYSSYSIMSRIYLSYGLSICVLTLIITYYASLPVTHYDTHLYHLNVVKWASEYATVPGIVNLHGRLAINSSFHLFAALTNNWLWQDKTAHITLGFLVCITAIQWLVEVVCPANHQKRLPKIFCMLSFPYILVKIFSGEVASLSTDLAAGLLCLVVILEVLKLPPMALAWVKEIIIYPPRKYYFQMLLLCSLAAAMVTVKLTGIPILLVIGLLVLFIFSKQSKTFSNLKENIRCILVIMSLPLCLLLGFMARNIILSGWLLYPFPVGNLSLAWSAPESAVAEMLNSITSWARMPGKAWNQVLGQGFLYWFVPWFDKFKGSTEFILLVAAGIIVLVEISSRRVGGLRLMSSLPTLAAVLSGAVGIAFWFLTAPDLRFGSVFILGFFAAVSSPILAVTGHAKLLGVLILLATLGVSYWAGGLDIHFPSERPAWVDVQPVPAKPIKCLVVADGQIPPLVVFAPVTGDQCGNSPLPCTPYIYMGIPKQRVPGDVSKGFLPDSLPMSSVEPCSTKDD